MSFFSSFTAFLKLENTKRTSLFRKVKTGILKEVCHDCEVANACENTSPAFVQSETRTIVLHSVNLSVYEII